MRSIDEFFLLWIVVLVICQRTLQEGQGPQSCLIFSISFIFTSMYRAFQSTICFELIFACVTLTSLPAGQVAVSVTNCLLNSQTQQARMIWNGLRRF